MQADLLEGVYYIDVGASPHLCLGWDEEARTMWQMLARLFTALSILVNKSPAAMTGLEKPAATDAASV